MRTLLALLLLPAFALAAPPEKYWVYFGTYTGPKSQGIYRAEFDSAEGRLGEPTLAAEVKNPSFLAINPAQTQLFAVCELNDFNGKKGGGVASFSLDAKTGELKAINQQSAVGTGPCHITCDKTGKNVLIANYGGGSAAVLPIGAEGVLGEATSFVQHKGTGPIKSRQEAPHVHSANLDKAGRFAVFADLGLDKVFVYKFDSSKGTITPNNPSGVETEPGAGPRHLSFHPNGNYAYVCNELDSTVTALSYDPDKGVFTKLNTLSTLAAPHAGNSTAEVVVHPSGKFVYVSNRGHNSIAVFKIEESTGKISAVGHQKEGINIPRNFNIDPTGKWMIVANQSGNSAIVFAIDPKTGNLTPTAQKIEIPSPVCVKFVPKS
jgi:6-phosphogluconolactonase